MQERKGRSDVDHQEWRQVRSTEAERSRVLVTLLFTDLVGSTETAAALGDRRWRELLGRHHLTVRELLGRFDGRELDDAGDGFFAIFDTATAAVRCGLELTYALWAIDLSVRVGLHTGECERLGTKVTGVAVHAAARLVRLAGPREVLVTSTVRDVVAGSGLRFEERGSHELHGLPGRWQLFAAAGQERDREVGSAGRDPVHVARRAVRRNRRSPLQVGSRE
jgi:class 3 adenylate cyclase